MGFDIKPYLKVIEKSSDAVVVYFTDNANTIPKRKLTNAFWTLPSTNHDAIVDWFYSKTIRKIVFNEYGYVFKQDS